MVHEPTSDPTVALASTAPDPAPGESDEAGVARASGEPGEAREPGDEVVEAGGAGGAVRAIVRWGTPVMHTPCQPVTAFDDELRALVADMVVTMAAAEGVGLAAPQVGVDLAVFVYDCPDDDHQFRRGVVCNPVLELPLGRDRHLEVSEEGCLSLPGAHAELARPDQATCRGQDEFGEPVEIHGTGLLARCLQHETDHLRGVVFGDRLPGRVRRRLLRDHEDVASDYPPDWPQGG